MAPNSHHNSARLFGIHLAQHVDEGLMVRPHPIGIGMYSGKFLAQTGVCIYIWRFVKMSVPGFVDKSQFHACRLMFAFKKHDLPWWLDDVKTWKFFVTFGNLLKPQESANARRFSFAVAGTISWTVCLCVCASLNAICFLTCLLINAVSLL